VYSSVVMRSVVLGTALLVTLRLGICHAGYFCCHLAVNMSERVLLSFISCLVGSLGIETVGFVEQVFTGQKIFPVAQQMVSSQ